MRPLETFLSLFWFLFGFLYIFPENEGKGNSAKTQKDPKSAKAPEVTTASADITPLVSTTQGVVTRPSNIPITESTSVITTTSTTTTPSENDPRVGWVYRLSKAELVSTLSDVGLSVEGNANDLRKRFVSYIRAQRTPSREDIPVVSDSKEPEFSLYYAGLPPVSAASYAIAHPTCTQAASNILISSQADFLNTNNSSTNQHEIDMVKEMLGLSPSANAETVKRNLFDLVTYRKQHEKNQMTAKFPFLPNTTSIQTRPETYFQSSNLSVPKMTPYQTTSCIPARIQNNYQYPNPMGTAPIPYLQAAPNLNLESNTDDLARTCNTVRKWNLRYDGGKDAISFLERLSELLEAYAVNKQSLLRALPELLKGQALLWFRNNKDYWNGYDDFYEAFQQHFLPLGYRRMLEDEIKRRTQGESEKFRDFVTALMTLMRRHGGYSQNDQLNHIYSNMRPDYKLTIRRENFSSVVEFIQLAESYENYLHERIAYRPPPNPSQVMIPETAYDPKTNPSKSAGVALNNSKPVKFTYTRGRNMVNNANYSDNLTPFSESEQPTSDLAYKSFSASKPPISQRSVNNSRSSDQLPESPRESRDIVCYNCGRPGHRFRECNKPKVIKCFYCKKPGVRTIHCDCHQGNGHRDQGAGGTLNLVYQSNRQPPQIEKSPVVSRRK